MDQSLNVVERQAADREGSLPGVRVTVNVLE
jgi:hypothetical protein